MLEEAKMDDAEIEEAEIDALREAEMGEAKRDEATADPVGNASTADKVKGKKKPQTVETMHLTTLVCSYNRHFAECSKSRKKQISQLIPGPVWKEVSTKDLTFL